MLAAATEAEDIIIREREVKTEPNESDPEGGPKKRCSHCRKKGHTVENCFKKQHEFAKALAEAELALVKPKLACYGCNAPGYVRSNCPNCSKETKIMSPMMLGFNPLGIWVGRDIPIVNVELFGIPGQAYFDTGAKKSVASSNLWRLMKFKGCTFQTEDCQTVLSDGTTTVREILTTTCNIGIGGRSLDIKFLIFPDDKNNRTLLGSDFLEQAQIVLNMGQRYWHFEGSPSQVFDFAEEWPLELNLIETIKVVEAQPKRKASTEAAPEHDEPQFITPKRTCQNVVSKVESYDPDYDQSDHNPHSVRPDMVTTERTKASELFPSTSNKNQEDIDSKFFIPL
ncbi:uncharacterized protein [Musca autumnalis]|uniref:uncharacterized protein n=1 Tax=Musca autumnalis TaxID=221902 RepID=UPI003CFB44A6